jgi:hypothetical protein
MTTKLTELWQRKITIGDIGEEAMPVEYTENFDYALGEASSVEVKLANGTKLVSTGAVAIANVSVETEFLEHMSLGGSFVDRRVPINRRVELSITCDNLEIVFDGPGDSEPPVSISEVKSQEELTRLIRFKKDG